MWSSPNNYIMFPNFDILFAFDHCKIILMYRVTNRRILQFKLPFESYYLFDKIEYKIFPQSVVQLNAIN